MFSEFNEQRVATSLEREVVQTLGFKLAEEKLHVSVHLNDYGRPGGAPAGVVVSLVVADKEARACTVRKIKSSTAKVCAIGGPGNTLLRGAQDQVLHR